MVFQQKDCPKQLLKCASLLEIQPNCCISSKLEHFRKHFGQFFCISSKLVHFRNYLVQFFLLEYHGSIVNSPFKNLHTYLLFSMSSVDWEETIILSFLFPLQVPVSSSNGRWHGTPLSFEILQNGHVCPWHRQSGILRQKRTPLCIRPRHQRSQTRRLWHQVITYHFCPFFFYRHF